MQETIKNNVSVVMVSYHTGPVLEMSIRSVLQQHDLLELIIIDNGNPSETQRNLRSWSDREPQLKYITGHGNVGFAGGCNLGVKNASGDYILLLNPDCILPENAIEDVKKEMLAYPEAWLAGCCLCNTSGKPEDNNKRNLLTPEVSLSEVFHLWKIDTERFPRLNLVQEKGQTISEYVPAISGAFMMIRRERYLEIGAMDGHYFFHVEDLDFCRAINVQGGKVLYVPSVNVVHHRSSSNVSSFFIEWHKTKGFIRYFYKHYSHSNVTGFLLLLTLAIYIRFIVRIPKIILRNLTLKHSPKLNIEEHKAV